MASTTTNLELTKPANGENYSLDVWNANMQKIDDFAGKLPNKMKLARDSRNASSFSFPVTRQDSGSYSYFLLIGGVGSSRGTIYHGFVHVAGTDTVVLTPVIGSINGIQATYNGTNLTITSTETIYGGLRLIWLS